MTSTNNRFTAVALIAILLGAGVAIGVGVDRVWLRSGSTRPADRRSPAPPFEMRVAQFRERLGLSDQQVAKIEAILDTASDEADAIHDRFEPEMKQVRERSRTALRAVLTPEQAAEYDRMSREWEQRFERRRRGSRGHGPGHGPGPRRGGRRGGGPPGQPGGRHGGFGTTPAPADQVPELDADGDGKLSPSECRAGPHPFVREVMPAFDQIDSDHDGLLSAEELETWASRPRGRAPI